MDGPQFDSGVATVFTITLQCYSQAFLKDFCVDIEAIVRLTYSSVRLCYQHYFIMQNEFLNERLVVGCIEDLRPFSGISAISRLGSRR